MSIKIKLSRQDMHSSYTMGTDTVAICKALGFKPRSEVMGGKDRVEQNIDAFKSEFAVARYLGIDPPVMNFITDYGVDLWLGECAIDVKLTNTDYLIFDSLNSFKSDIAVLCSMEDINTVLMSGWISKDNFELLSVEKDFGYGTRKVVNSSSLAEMESLKNFCVYN